MEKDNEGIAKFIKALKNCPVCGGWTSKQDDNMGTFYISCTCGFRAEYDYYMDV